MLFYFSENMRNLGKHSIKLQVVLNESNSTTFAGKELPSHHLRFTVVGKKPVHLHVMQFDLARCQPGSILINGSNLLIIW